MNFVYACWKYNPEPELQIFTVRAEPDEAGESFFLMAPICESDHAVGDYVVIVIVHKTCSQKVLKAFKNIFMPKDW